MFYYFLYPLRDVFFGFNVFRYITFRAAGAAVTALILCVLCGPMLIRWARRLGMGERVRRDYFALYEQHKCKEGTPTMGGVIILIAIIIAILLWADLQNHFVLLVISALIWLGLLGFADDYSKARGKHPGGMSPRRKLLGQVVFGLGIAAYCVWHPETREYISELRVPFYKHPLISDIGAFYYLFVVCVLVGSSNAVNLTDGLDGLATGCVVVAALAYAVMSYVTGHAGFAEYLQIRYIPGSGELSICCAAMVGAGLGFLWFNAYPAEIFMGDTGSLALGGAVGLIAILIKRELALLLVGGVFFMEAVSVIMQVGSFKLTGRRIFLMAPLHHHFEMKGWPETKVTVRFWIIAIIFALLSLGALKLQ